MDREQFRIISSQLTKGSKLRVLIPAIDFYEQFVKDRWVQAPSKVCKIFAVSLGVYSASYDTMFELFGEHQCARFVATRISHKMSQDRSVRHCSA